MKQTAMQELFDNLEAIDITIPIGVKEIFLEKEKEQIIKFANDYLDDDEDFTVEQYYEENYKK
jgi:hypothetical protein